MYISLSIYIYIYICYIVYIHIFIHVWGRQLSMLYTPMFTFYTSAAGNFARAACSACACARAVDMRLGLDGRVVWFRV